MGWALGPVGWVFPGPPEQKGCIQKPSIFPGTPGNADSTGQTTTMPRGPFHHLLCEFSPTSTCTRLMDSNELVSGRSQSGWWKKAATQGQEYGL